jgi:hypothetical protein
MIPARMRRQRRSHEGRTGVEHLPPNPKISAVGESDGVVNRKRCTDLGWHCQDAGCTRYRILSRRYKGSER